MYRLLKERGHHLSVVLANDDAKSDGAKISNAMVGEHEARLWSGSVFPEYEAAGHRGNNAFLTWSELAEEAGLQVVRLEKNKSINSKNNIAVVREMKPDLIFSARFLHIFKEKVMAIPKYGIFNTCIPVRCPSTRGYTWLCKR